MEAPQEPTDRRMERDALELVGIEQPVAAHCLVARDDRGERAVELGSEHDVDDVLRPEAALRRDRVDDRDGALDRDLVALLGQSRSPRRARGAAPGSGSPRSVHRHRAGANARRRASRGGRGGSGRASGGSPTPGHAARVSSRPQRSPDEPKPPSPRSVAVTSRVSTTSTAAIGTTTSWAMRMPGSTVNACSRSVLRRITRTSPR